MSGFVKAAKGLRDLFEHHVRTPGHGCNEAERVKIGACFAAFDEALRTERDLTNSGSQSATSEMEAVLEPWRAVWKVAFEPYDDGRHADDEGVAPLMPLAWPTIGDLRKLANPPAAQVDGNPKGGDAEQAPGESLTARSRSDAPNPNQEQSQ